MWKNKLLPGVLALIIIITAFSGCFGDDGDVKKNGDEDEKIEKELEIESHKIHSRSEGIIIPFEETDIEMEQADVSIRPDYWECMVGNVDFHVISEFQLYNPTSEAVIAELAFPFSTHSLFGDHEEQEKFDIFVNDDKITYDVAMNKDLYSYKTEDSDYSELNYKNDSIGNNKHDLLTDADDLFSVAPSLYNDGFEMFAYWELEFQPDERFTVGVNFIHYSGFGCSGDCGHTGMKFVYNIDYSEYWPGLIEFNVSVSNLYNATITTSLDVNLPGQKYVCSGTDSSENIVVKISRPDKIFNVNGKVYDQETNEPIEGAEVGVENYEPVLTNETGLYSLKITEMGTWAIYASKEGYKDLTQTIDLYQEYNYLDFYLVREGNTTAG